MHGSRCSVVLGLYELRNLEIRCFACFCNRGGLGECLLATTT